VVHAQHPFPHPGQTARSQSAPRCTPLSPAIAAFMLAWHARSYRRWRRQVQDGTLAGIPMSSHLYPEVSGHLLRVTPTRHWLKWQD
jgi:hypothetical protein